MKEPKEGVCCACGYDGPEEIRCPERSKKHKRKFDSCCEHWRDGAEEVIL